ncbi:MAG TPA: hypothetical protein VFY84_19180 [Jiangellales bacterium]|nr:hypothetical protein [Jiangellales bacterium]
MSEEQEPAAALDEPQPEPTELNGAAPVSESEADNYTRAMAGYRPVADESEGE